MDPLASLAMTKRGRALRLGTFLDQECVLEVHPRDQKGRASCLTDNVSTEPGVHTEVMDEEERPPICPRCGVTMVPGELSANDDREREWVCLECEELGEEE